MHEYDLSERKKLILQAIVESHISPRLNEHIEHAIPTAIPRLGETRMFGNVVGNKVGSVILLS